jgi:hypothetical protein
MNDMPKTWKMGDKSYWPGWSSFSECMSSFCREGPNAGKPGPCPDPEKAKRRAEIKAGKVKVEPKKMKPEASKWKGEATGSPMGYKAFIAAGNADKDWEDYAAEANASSAKKRESAFVDSWQSGSEVHGNDIMNRFRKNGINPPDKIKKILQHEDTKISRSNLTARGLSRNEAKSVHEFVVNGMGAVSQEKSKPAQSPKPKPKPPGLFDGKDTPPSAEYLRLKAMRLKHASTGSMYTER